MSTKNILGYTMMAVFVVAGLTGWALMIGVFPVIVACVVITFVNLAFWLICS